MARAFLSHSSKDQHVVSQVAEALKLANTHRDVETFDSGKLSAKEIIDGLGESDLFVLFVSKHSVAAPWVRFEVDQALTEIGAGRIRRVLTIILDDDATLQVPEWMRKHTYVRQRSPNLISELIRSKLIEIAVEQSKDYELFIGRQKEISDLANSLSRPESESPVAIYIAGWDGIGRRTVLRRVIRDLFPWLQRIQPEIVLSDEAGPLEFYMQLREMVEPLSGNDWVQLTQEFEKANDKERISRIAETLRKVTDGKRLLILKGHNALVRDNGDIQDWIASVIREIGRVRMPVIALIARRMVPFGRRQKYRSVHFASVGNLSPSESRSLLSQWLKRFDCAYDSVLLDDVSRSIGGHPQNVELAARYAREYGTERLKSDKKSFHDFMYERAASVLQSIQLDANSEIALSLLSDYEALSIGDLLFASMLQNENLGGALEYLRDHGIVETDGVRFRVAAHLADAVSRTTWTSATEKYRRDAAKRMSRRLEEFKASDHVSIAALDAGLLASVRERKDPSTDWARKVLRGAHLLRAAGDSYDQGRFEEAANLALRAVENGWSLTTEARTEALRLRAMALARLPDQGNAFYKCVDGLKKINSNHAKRNLYFVQGFKMRLEGRLDMAEDMFRKAYMSGGDRNYHVLRELAQVLLGQNRFDEAEGFARTAYEVAPTNVYTIDIVLESLIEKCDHKKLASNAEIERLLGELKEASARADSSHYEARICSFYSKLGDHDTAEEWATKAVSQKPHMPIVRIVRAEAFYRAKQPQRMDDDLRELENLVRDPSRPENKRYAQKVARLRVRQLTALRRFDEARRVLDRLPGWRRSVKEELRKDIEVEEAHASSAGRK